jgi:hypothetical protein
LSGVLLVLPLEVLFGSELVEVSELLLLFFLCFFFVVVVVEVVVSVLDPEVPPMSPVELDEPLVVELGLLLLGALGSVPLFGELVPDCCATAMPIENNAAVLIERSFLDIRISYFRSGSGMRWRVRG